jgi:FAD-dependent urate hydroxylase
VNPVRCLNTVVKRLCDPNPASAAIAATGFVVSRSSRFARFFGYAVRPSKETYWFSNFARRDEPARDELLSVAFEEWRAQLLELHRDDPPDVARILRAVSGAGAYAVYDLPSLPSWCRGRVCLIGDAAHAIGPRVGQGVSLALEDAVVAAKCLRDVADPAAAFVTFERLRRGRVEPIAPQSRRTGQQKAPAGRVARKMHDLLLPMFLSKAANAAERLYAYRLDWNEPIVSEGRSSSFQAGPPRGVVSP